MRDNKIDLLGTWKLVSYEFEDKESGKKEPFNGDASPSGYLILTREGRLMTLIASGRRKPGGTVAKQAALYRTMVSYTGVYTVEGDRFITKVDLSWNASWNGTDQVRYYKLAGDRLEILFPWAPHAKHADGRVARAILSWERSR